MRIKLRVKLILSNYAIFKVIYKFFSSVHTNLVGNDTEIVIEGFPRCGNTFALASFKYSNPVIKTATHVHLPYQIIFAKKYNTPTIILLRNPLDSISSLIIRDSNYTINEAVIYYIKFHKTVLEYKNYMILSDFSSTINDFPSIIKKLNDKKGTDFQYHDNKLTTINKIKNKLEKEEAEKYGKGYEKVFGLPSNKRKNEKVNLVSEIENNRNFNFAKEIYNSLVRHIKMND